MKIFRHSFAILADESVFIHLQTRGWGGGARHRNCRKKSLVVKDHYQLFMCFFFYVYNKSVILYVTMYTKHLYDVQHSVHRSSSYREWMLLFFAFCCTEHSNVEIKAWRELCCCFVCCCSRQQHHGRNSTPSIVPCFTPLVVAGGGGGGRGAHPKTKLLKEWKPLCRRSRLDKQRLIQEQGWKPLFLNSPPFKKGRHTIPKIRNKYSQK